MNVQRHFAVTLGSQILSTAQGIVVMPLVIRLAGLAVYGAFVVWPNALSLIFAASYFGVGYTYRRRVASADTIAARRALFFPQFSYQLSTLTLICVFGLLVVFLFRPKILVGGDNPSITILALWIAIHFLFFQTQEYFRNTLRYDYFNLINILNNVLSVIAIVVWGLLGRHVTLVVLLVLTTAAKALATLPWLVLLVRELGPPKLQLPIGSLAKDIRTGWPLFLDFLSYNMLAFGDRYLITIFLSIVAVGEYQPGYQLAYLLIFIPRCGDMLLPPLLARLIDGNNRDGATHLTTDFLHLFLMIGIPYIVGAILVGPSVIAFVSDPGTAYISRWVTTLVVLGTLLYGVTLFYYQGAYVLGRMRFVMVSNALGACLNIALNLILLAVFKNITVCAIACVLSYAVTAVYIVRAMRTEWRLYPDWRRIARFVGASSAMGGALALAGFRPLEISRMPLAEVVGSILGAGGLYFAILWMLGALKLEMISQLTGSSNAAGH